VVDERSLVRENGSAVTKRHRVRGYASLCTNMPSLGVELVIESRRVLHRRQAPSSRYWGHKFYSGRRRFISLDMANGPLVNYFSWSGGRAF
jgi:hypothetical protein